MTKTEFARIQACSFQMGAADGLYPEDGEAPRRSVQLDTFSIAKTAVSNAEFAEFVSATGYKTQAEIRGASHVFFKHLTDPSRHPEPFADVPWWREVKGAHWRAPNGTRAAEADDPVVHITYRDAQSYCTWRSARLPTEAEWECAAQGSETLPLNIWAGVFPDDPDHAPGPKPVSEAAPNPHGLYHACGNVWEWTADGFGRLHSPRKSVNPTGNLAARYKVVKGGSYLCSPSYCARFRPSSRRAEHPNAATGHLGFRVVMKTE